VAPIYFSPRLLCRLDLAFNANSTSWRIASEHPAASVVLVDELDRTVERCAFGRCQTRNNRTVVSRLILFNFRQIRQCKPLFAGRISESIVKRDYFQ
jgi:hypothetical protein